MKGSGLALPKGNYFYFNTNNNCGEAIPQGKESYSPKSELSTHITQQKTKTFIMITLINQTYKYIYKNIKNNFIKYNI